MQMLERRGAGMPCITLAGWTTGAFNEGSLSPLLVMPQTTEYGELSTPYRGQRKA